MRNRNNNRGKRGRGRGGKQMKIQTVTNTDHQITITQRPFAEVDLTDDNAPSNPMKTQQDQSNFSEKIQYQPTSKKLQKEFIPKIQNLHTWNKSSNNQIQNTGDLFINFEDNEDQTDIVQTEQHSQVPQREEKNDSGGNTGQHQKVEDVTNTALEEETVKNAQRQKTLAETTKDEQIAKVLTGIPSEIKLVVQDKLKMLDVVKTPIIMPKETVKVEEKPHKTTAADFFRSSTNTNQFPTLQQRQAANTENSDGNTEKIVQNKTVKPPQEIKASASSVKPIPTLQQRQIVKTLSSEGKGGKIDLQTNTVKQPKYSDRRITNYLASINQTYSYPKGIPRTFLVNAITGAPPNEFGIPEPYLQTPEPQWAPANEHFYPPPTNYQEPQMFVQTDQPDHELQLYSPTEVCGPNIFGEVPDQEEPTQEGSQSPTTGQKRVSAFQRLGPVTQPKKPKLTINLLFSKEQAVREVVDDDGKLQMSKTPEVHVPVHERPDIISSTNPIVTKNLPFWPWKHNVGIRHEASANKNSCSEGDKIDEVSFYNTNNTYMKVSLTGYPSNWKKEDVLDFFLDVLKDKSIIPCFIEFTPKECYFLVLRCRAALLYIHRQQFVLTKDRYTVNVKIYVTELTRSYLRFTPTMCLSQMVSLGYDEESVLRLPRFCLEPDVSHFVYFPLSRPLNQVDLIQRQNTVAWNELVELDLSGNRMTTIHSLDLAKHTPNLKILDLSHNRLDKMMDILCCRGLQLKSLKLEGNPLCLDYIDADHYVKVAKLLFPTLTELDGVKLPSANSFPEYRHHYCPLQAKCVVERFLEIFFPLLDAQPEDRIVISELYHEQAIWTLTYNPKLRYKSTFRLFRDLFNRWRDIQEDNYDRIDGSSAITKNLCRWPALHHDPKSFVIDVLSHNNNTTIFRVSGLLRITTQTEDNEKHILYFVRTIVLRSKDGVHYKIRNEILHWGLPTEHCLANTSLATEVMPKQVNLKLETVPDEDLKEKLVTVFMKITNLNKKRSERCLEMKSWDFREALELFVKLLKLNTLETLDMCEDKVVS